VAKTSPKDTLLAEIICSYSDMAKQRIWETESTTQYIPSTFNINANREIQKSHFLKAI